MLFDNMIIDIVVTPFVIIIAVAMIIHMFWKRWIEKNGSEDCDLPLPPGNVGFFWVGETFKLAIKKYNFFKDRRDKHGTVYKTHIFGQPTIRVYGSDNLTVVLRAEELFVTMHWPESVKRLLGRRGVSHLSRREHSLRRTHLIKVFNHQAIAGYLSSVRTTVHEDLVSWCRLTPISVRDESRRLAVDIVTQSLMGVHFSGKQTAELCEALSHIEGALFSLPINFPFTSFRRGLLARATILRLMTGVTTGDQRGMNDFMRMMHESEGICPVTAKDVLDDCISTLFSSFQGISSAMCTMMLALTRHPRCAEKAKDELNAAGLLRGNEELTYDKLQELHYVNNIVKEVLRLVPPVGGGYRKVLKTFDLQGYRIPEGWTLIYSIRDQHQVGDTGVDKPDDFDPDRWSDESRLSKMNKCSYLTFGGDRQRSCIGARFVNTVLAVTLIDMLANFKWTMENTEPEMIYFPVPYPKNGLPVIFARNDA